MHLRSRHDQTVEIDGREISFAKGETIHTENSYKFSLDDFAALARRAGFAQDRTWSDEQELFSIHYLSSARMDAPGPPRHERRAAHATLPGSKKRGGETLGRGCQCGDRRLHGHGPMRYLAIRIRYGRASNRRRLVAPQRRQRDFRLESHLDFFAGVLPSARARSGNAARSKAENPSTNRFGVYGRLKND